MSTRGRKAQKKEAPVEPEIVEPSEDDLAGEFAAGPVIDIQADGQLKPDTTAVAPVTGLQQYLAEVRRYPYLSKEEELLLFHEYQTQGSREAA